MAVVDVKVYLLSGTEFNYVSYPSSEMFVLT